MCVLVIDQLVSLLLGILQGKAQYAGLYISSYTTYYLGKHCNLTEDVDNHKSNHIYPPEEHVQ